MKRDNAQAKKPPLTRIQRAHKAKRRPTHTVSFRLDDDYLTKLEAIGTKRGNSIHEQAREMLMALLIGDEAELLALRMTLDGVNEKLEGFIGGMADTLEAILIMNGTSEEKARSFIDARLRNRAFDQ